MYADADIYLLDDPISAVDAAVGRQIFEKCIRMFLRRKTVLLVTHQIHFLKRATKIIVLNKGEIEGMGTYAELEKMGINFHQHVKSAESHQGATSPNQPKENLE